MIETGRLCIKIAGRDAGKKCVVVDVIDETFALIDGETRRKKVNIKHIEPTNKKIDIKKGASHEVVVSEFKKLGVTIKPKKSKPKTERPRKQRKKKAEKGKAEEGKEKEKTEKKKEDKNKDTKEKSKAL